MDRRRGERLERILQLRERGALTDEEYAAEKAAIMSRRAGPSRSVLVVVVLSAAVLIAAAAFGLLSTRREAPASVSKPRPVRPADEPRSSAPLPAASPAMSPAERLAAAFRAVTGRRGTYRQRVGEDLFEVTPARLLDLPFGPVLVTRRRLVDGCHACSGYLGVYYLKDDAGGFVVAGSYPKAVEGDGFGVPPSKWSLVDRFTANPAVFSEGGYMAQGIVTEGTTITELTPRGPIGSETVMTSYDDAGSRGEGDPRPVCIVKGTIAHVRRDEGFDVVVTGSRKAVDHYVSRNGRFVPLSRIDWGLPCG